ncbi:hypothetical protein [Winogradskyella sp. 3972H.M.0a.05]|uniref:hypothetical protein n=1 Tax=Winogradskyella sp. 3972H.M.0a.05 TaxID=2950277 RepID=UPI003392EA81
MKRDIRPLLKNTSLSTNKLPENHREEFIKKLGKEEKRKPIPWLKIAASILLFLAIGYSINSIIKRDTDTTQPLIVQQIKAVEQEYLNNIDKEWQQFIMLTNDEKLISRYEQKLEDLDADYKKISAQFIKDSNNIFVIEELVNNLQTRLKLLKDIQHQIILINQQNEQHETSI